MLTNRSCKNAKCFGDAVSVLVVIVSVILCVVAAVVVVADVVADARNS